MQSFKGFTRRLACGLGHISIQNQVCEMISRCVLLCSGTHPMQKMIRLMSHPDPGGLGWYEKEALVLQVVHSSSSAYPEYSLG